MNSKFSFVSQTKYPKFYLQKTLKFYLYLDNKKIKHFDGYLRSAIMNKKITQWLPRHNFRNTPTSREKNSLYWKTDGNKQEFSTPP
jgi:hypothetical protein